MIIKMNICNKNTISLENKPSKNLILGKMYDYHKTFINYTAILVRKLVYCSLYANWKKVKSTS